MHVEVAEDLHAVLEPGYVRSGVALGQAQEGDLVAEHVLVVKVRGQQNFRALVAEERFT